MTESRQVTSTGVSEKNRSEKEVNEECRARGMRGKTNPCCSTVSFDFLKILHHCSTLTQRKLPEGNSAVLSAALLPFTDL